MKYCFCEWRRVLMAQKDIVDAMNAIATVLKLWSTDFSPSVPERSSITPSTLSDGDVTPSSTDGRKLWVEDRFCWRFCFDRLCCGFFPRDALPNFDTSVTPEGRDPAKMKWMFKEDHSLGKNGGSGLLWNDRSGSISSCCEPSLPLFSFIRAVLFFLLSLSPSLVVSRISNSRVRLQIMVVHSLRGHRRRMTLQNVLTC